jgi:hypothetical protein
MIPEPLRNEVKTAVAQLADCACQDEKLGWADLLLGLHRLAQTAQGRSQLTVEFDGNRILSVSMGQWQEQKKEY